MALGETRILVGACVRQDPAVLRAHLQTLKWQKVPFNVVIDYAFVVDDETSDAVIAEVLPGALRVRADGRPADAVYTVGQVTHEWNVSTFDHLAKQKQWLLNHAQTNRYDYIWLVDSDLLLDPLTLTSLLSAEKEIVSAVFWTEWQNNVATSLGPNVWLKHPYELTKFKWPPGRLFHELSRRQLVQVAGGGACCLISAKVLDKVRYFPRLPDLPNDGMWQGEDRTFAIVAERMHVKQWADGWPDVFHAYHRDMRTQEVLDAMLTHLGAERQQRASYGDLVSFSLEALEEGPNFGQVSVRGRIGGLDVLPEVEAALLDLAPEQEIVLSLAFPPWYPEVNLWDGREPQKYAGKDKVVRLRLHDIKPYSFQPILADVAFRGMRDE